MDKFEFDARIKPRDAAPQGEKSQWDKIEEKKRARGKKRTVNKIIFIIITAGAVIWGGGFLYTHLSPLFGQSADAVSYTPNERAAGVSFKNTYFFTSTDGLHAVNVKGADQNPETAALVSPFIRAMKEPVFLKSDKSALAFDISGKTAVLFDERGILSQYGFEREIITAKMNNRGRFIIVLYEDGAKAEVQSYEQDGSLMHSWHSGTGYVADAMIHDTKNMFAVITNEISDGVISSKIFFFKLDSPYPAGGITVSDKIASFVSYYGNGVLVMCEDGLYYAEDKTSGGAE
jgi:hypothetical protein